MIARRALAALAAFTLLAVTPAPAPRAPWLDARLPVGRRVDALLAQMTLPEKLGLLHGWNSAVPVAGYVPGIARLHVPPLYLSDGPAGVRLPGTTALPAPIALGATWDRALAATYGDVLARDNRAMGNDVALGPMINVVRTAQHGRSFESLGEDPYLISALVVPEVAAIERGHVIATVKHYAVNNQENGRLRDSSDVDARTFHEIYLPGFAAASAAGAGAVMCSYNRIDGVWACENPRMLGILRRDAGFRGFVMSDWGATHSTVAASNAGLDMQMPDASYFGAPLAAAVAAGTVSIAQIDTHVRRILRAMFAAGIFEHPPHAGTLPEAADRAAARSIAESAAVLLKNDDALLPLDARRVRSIALIGADMDADTRGGSAWVEGTGTVSPLAAIRAAAPHAAISYTWAAPVPFIGTLPTVDMRTLAPPNATAGVHGVQAEYFADQNAPAGWPVALMRTEPSIDQNWQFGNAYPGGNTGYSVHWSGSFTPPVSGTYTLGIEARGGARMTFDGGLPIIDEWTPAYDITTTTFARRLVGGRAYPFTVEAHHLAGSGAQLVRMVWQPPAGIVSPDLAAAVKAARSASVAIVFVGEFRTEQFDRSTIALTGGQVRLIRAVARANPRTIVVLNNGGPVAMGAWLRAPRAILDMWYPGEENGDALAALLFGAVNPSGKLPVTMPAQPWQIAARVTWPAAPYDGPARQIRYAERLDVGYRWYQAHHVAPAFPFGYGLSYTTFAFSRLRAVRTSADTATVSADVTNTGRRMGAEVAQLYLAFPAAAGEPPEVLRGFEKITLAPRQTRRVVFSLDSRAFSVWDVTRAAWRVVPGRFRVLVGDSSADLPLNASLAIR